MDSWAAGNASNLDHLQQWLRDSALHGILVPSTDEYLSEWAPPFTRRLEWLTGFRGSMGLAAVVQNRAALFLDGRYQEQGKRETAGLKIEVLDASEAVLFRWLGAHISAGHRLAIDTRLQSYPEIEQMLAYATQHEIQVVELGENPVDELWGAQRPSAPWSVVIDYPVQFAGTSTEEKCRQLREWLSQTGTECHLLADPEDVAWLLNVRTNSRMNDSTANDGSFVPVPLSRALVEVTANIFWFIDRSRLEPGLMARLEGAVEVIDPARFDSLLKERITGKVVSANLLRTPHKIAALTATAAMLHDDPVVARQRWKKHPSEIERAREAHFQDGQAVIRFLAWLREAVQEGHVTELEASEKLSEFRMQLSDYQGMSMPSMSASGASGALAHYVPSKHSNRTLNDHPIYWMDSGGHYYGGSTDNTVCVAVGSPEARHVRAHTLVVKGFIALTLARFPAGIHSTQLDSFARQYLWQEGMDYRHGTGHGVGNFMNIHEGPAIRKEIDHPLIGPMEAGMVVSNEPAYYADGDFGIRLEGHLVTVPSKYEGFLEFELLSRLPIDPRLIDQSLLTASERRWLSDYHVWIANSYKGCFDEETVRWLQEIVDSYLAMVC